MSNTPHAPVVQVSGLIAHKGSTWEALEGIRLRYDVPSHFVTGKDDEEALEIIFRQCNRVDGNEWISKCGFRARSLSCGDVVSIDDRHYICQGCGWQQLDRETAEWVVANITFRDFCMNLSATVRINKLEVPPFVTKFLTA
jgi:predicted Fe-S protein YdhL (DUF1289 family)